MMTVGVQQARICAVGWLSATLALAGTAMAAGGAITGDVTNAASGVGIKRVAVRAYAHGRCVAVGASTENDGSFVLRELAPGAYSVCVAGGENYRPVVVPNVTVTAGKDTVVHLKAGQSLAIEDDCWVQPYPSFCQSFVASGLGLTLAGMKGYGPGRAVTLQVLKDDGPTGDKVGPTRTTPVIGGESTGMARWSGGEVPTIPGASYTLRMSAPAGETWIPGLAGRGDVYPSGSAYFGTSGRPDSDIGICLCEDNDSLRTDYAVGASWRTFRARSMGQRFVALSRSITFASAVLSGVKGPPVYVRFSIHEDGPGGRQIGPSKGVEVGEAAAVSWGADAVPFVPGKTYYLHIETFSGLTILAAFAPDTYAQGSAFFDGAERADIDLCATVAGQISEQDYVRLVRHPRHLETIALVNPSFEEGDLGWHRMNGDQGAVVGCDDGVVPMWGGNMFGWTAKKEGENSRPTVYQQVKVKEGALYRFSASVYTDHVGGRSSDVKARLVAAPAGGTQLRDYDHITSSQWYATEGQWRRGSLEFEAEAETVTVGFELEQRFNLDSSSLYVDGAFLERIGAK